MQNFSELDTTIYLANMSAMRFWAQSRGKNKKFFVWRVLILYLRKCSKWFYILKPAKIGFLKTDVLI
jgi:hypothetical protein